MSKHGPHLRLKALRREIQTTQEKLAEWLGLSGSYIIAVETGRLPMTVPLANAIACTTGIGPAWLLGEEGKDSEPLTPVGRPYTRAYFLRAFAKRNLPFREIDPDGDESSQIHLQCHRLTKVMRAACRRDRLPIATHFFEEAMARIIDDLKLKKALDETTVEQFERFLFGFTASSIIADNFDQNDVDALCRLFSPTALIKWAEALQKSDADRDKFLDELDQLRELVTTSFISSPQKTESSKKKQKT
jgi:DNA-binding XRE family transcriptional regulator